MGNSFSRVFPCFSPSKAASQNHPDLFFSEPLDEGLGHSFCYVRSVIPGTSSRFSPSQSERFSPSHSERFSSRLAQDDDVAKIRSGIAETTFRSISGASVSANTSTPRTVLQENQCSNSNNSNYNCNPSHLSVNGFESSSSFSALPLQPVPRQNAAQQSTEVGFMSGPLERGFMSGPLERGFLSGPLDNADGLHFSAPLGGFYLKNRKKGLAGVRKALFRTFSEKQRPWVVPVLNFVGLQTYRDKKWYTGKDTVPVGSDSYIRNKDFCNDLQWAHGKAGEDRVHVVVSEELGWLFVGIYDGFNGPDAPEFLMSNLYKAVFSECEGLFWDIKEDCSVIEGQGSGDFVAEDVRVEEQKDPSSDVNQLRLPGGESSSTATDQNQADDFDRSANGSEDSLHRRSRTAGEEGEVAECGKNPSAPLTCGAVKRVTFQSEQCDVSRGKPLWELLAEEDKDDLDFLGSDRFAFSVDDEFVGSRITGNAGAHKGSYVEAADGIREEDSRDGNGAARQAADSSVSKVTYPDFPQKHVRGRSLLLSKLKHGFSKHKESHRKFFPWRYDWDKEKFEVETKVEERLKQTFRKRKAGPVDHELVLRALSQALETTEVAYLEMTDKLLDRNPELALMGSCLLVMLMKDEDVYVMNVGDSRAIVAQYQPEVTNSSRVQKVAQYQPEVTNSTRVPKVQSSDRLELEGIVEEFSDVCERAQHVEIEAPAQTMNLTALQLSTDHSTNIEEEVQRIKEEHPDDSQCIVNDRVKGRLKVTRAFGAGFLKHPKWNNALLEMFRNEYIGTSPYISCSPFLCHHRLGPNDQFLVLSSDGLYQYLSNQEVVSHVESFMEKFPEGDPAQYLIEELLFRAAKKAGMDFHELLDIPQGDRRKYHDDVTVMVISLEGRIWKSSGKYL